VLFLEIDHKAVEVVGCDASGGRPVGEEIQESIEDGFVLAEGVGFLQGFDNIQVSLKGDMERGAFHFLLRGCIGFEPESLTFKNVLAAPGCFLGVSGRSSRCLSLALATLPPLDEVSARGQRFPVVATMVVVRDGDEPPAIPDSDLFQDIDTRHDALPQAYRTRIRRQYNRQYGM
jgi:hypothetical protein